MKVIHSLDGFEEHGCPVVLAAGSFDGVHPGHHSIIDTAVSLAAAENAEAWVMSFEPHPAKILRPDQAPALLTSLEDKLRLIQDRRPSGVLLLPFDRPFSMIEPEDFIQTLVNKISFLRGIVVGPNWTFGRAARGNPSLLKELAGIHDFRVTVCDPVYADGELISSSRIREAIKSGQVDYANKLLGRPYAIQGKVIQGRKIGRQLGFPTANLDTRNELLPGSGIYAASAVTEDSVLQGAAYISTRNEQQKPLCEFHAFEADPDLYDEKIEISFLSKIREDREIEDTDELRNQIQQDTDEIRLFFHRKGRISC